MCNSYFCTTRSSLCTWYCAASNEHEDKKWVRYNVSESARSTVHGVDPGPVMDLVGGRGEVNLGSRRGVGYPLGRFWPKFLKFESVFQAFSLEKWRFCFQNDDFHKGNCVRRCKNAKKIACGALQALKLLKTLSKPITWCIYYLLSRRRREIFLGYI